MLNIGGALVARGHSVLFIDGDQQNNLGQSFAYNPLVSGTLAAVLRGELTMANAVMQVRENLYLLPAGPALNDAVAGRAKQPGAELALRKLLAPLTVDFVLIDTPGSLGKFTDVVLAAGAAVFIPLHPDNYGVSGLVKLILRSRLMEESVNPGLRVAGLFLTQYHPQDRRLILRQNIAAMRANPVLGPLFLQGTIRDNVAVKEAQSVRLSLQQYAPDCAAAVDYRLLTEEMLGRLTYTTHE